MWGWIDQVWPTLPASVLVNFFVPMLQPLKTAPLTAIVETRLYDCMCFDAGGVKVSSKGQSHVWPLHQYDDLG